MNKKIYLLLFLLILFFRISNAINFAQIDIYVENNGEVTIEGLTNLEELQNIKLSPKFTSKSQEFWILNISTSEELKSYTFNLYMPEYSKVNYIKTTPNLKISEENNRIKFVGEDNNKKLNILIQYKINKHKNIMTYNFIIYISLIFTFLAFLGIFLLLFRLTKTKNQIEIKEEVKKEQKIEKIKLPENLPERQKDIIKLLRGNKTLTQKQLEEKMEIPKSSISRNVKTLEIKGYVIKEKSGQTNYLKLNQNLE